MTSTQEEVDHATLLRRRAEEALSGRLVDVDDLPIQDIRYLLHELQVHQAELSIQNEELRQTQLELEAALDLYSDLYNFAPAGYCTLDQKGRILEANQTLGGMLGVPREALIGKTLSHFIDRADQDGYYLHCQRAFESRQRQISKIRMVKLTGEKIDVRLESMVAHQDESQLRIMLSDNTHQLEVEKEAQEAAILRELQHRMANQREQERQQVARDLHDGPIQDLLAILFALRELLTAHPDTELTQALESIQNDLKKQVGDLRAFTTELRPPTLSKFGLETTIRSHAETFQEKHPEFRIHLQLRQTGPLLTEMTALALYRIYQEALTNVIRHVPGAEPQIYVRLDKDEQQVRLEIQDNGPGFEMPEQWNDLVQQGHLGLIGMRERAEAVGGQLEIHSQKGAGTRVVVQVPLNHSATGQPAL